MNRRHRIISAVMSCTMLLTSVSMAALADDSIPAEEEQAVVAVQEETTEAAQNVETIQTDAADDAAAESVSEPTEAAQPEVSSDTADVYEEPAVVPATEEESVAMDSYDTQIEDFAMYEDGVMSSQMRAASATVLKSSGYTVQFQNAAAYRNIPYDWWGGTVFSSACGPAAACNAFSALGIADVNLLDMCKIAEDCGARVDGGTVESTLLKTLVKKYPFTYTTTSDPQVLKAHLKSGGAAIAHTGNGYPLFTTSGHFVTVTAIDSKDNVTVLDSYWSDTKFTSTSIRKNNVTVLSEGVVKTSLSQLNKACSDRSPRFYLITKKKTSELPFYDVDTEAWYYDQVKYVYQNNLMSGVSGSSFDPESTLTRAQAVQVLYNYEVKKYGKPTVTNAVKFSDVTSGKWYKTAVDWASAKGIVNGISSTKFNPDGNVTREQFMKILGKYMQQKASSKYNAGKLTALNSFSDKNNISNYATEYMAWAVNNGILTGSQDSGKMKLLPQNSAKRSEVAAIIQRYTKLVG